MRHIANPFSAVLDANVLYPFLTRDILLSLAAAGLYRPIWTAEIMDEWQRHLVANKPGKKEAIARTAATMTKAFPEALVTGHDTLIPSLELPDPNDRHVLAAALLSGAGVIVTENLKDFPADKLSPYAIEAVSADSFCLSTIQLQFDDAISALRTMRLRYHAPPCSPDELIVAMLQRGLTLTAAELQPHRALL